MTNPLAYDVSYELWAIVWEGSPMPEFIGAYPDVEQAFEVGVKIFCHFPTSFAVYKTTRDQYGVVVRREEC